MQTEKLPVDGWQKFFDELSPKNKPSLIKLEVMDKELGDQTEFEWVSLQGISYDPKRKEIDVITEQADHRIAPSEVRVSRNEDDVYIEIKDKTNRTQLLALKAA